MKSVEEGTSGTIKGRKGGTGGELQKILEKKEKQKRPPFCSMRGGHDHFREGEWKVALEDGRGKV